MTKTTTGPSNKGRLKAAGGQDSGKWIMETVLPRLRHHVQEHGTPVGASLYHIRINMSAFLRDDLGLKGSHVRVLQVLQKLRVAIILEHGLSGRAASAGEGKRPHLWGVNIHARPSARTINQALATIAEEAMEARRRKAIQDAKEERLAGQYPTSEAGGSEVETRHFHGQDNPLEHPHGESEGLHYHAPPEEYAGHQGPKGLYGDLDSAVFWLAYRHHTHKEKTGFHEHKAKVDANGTRETVVEGLTGDRPALVVSPNRDGRYRELLDAIAELRAKLSASLSREEASLSREEALEAELREARELLDSATDPTVEEAERVLGELGKR